MHPKNPRMKVTSVPYLVFFAMLSQGRGIYSATGAHHSMMGSCDSTQHFWPGDVNT